MKRSLSIEGGTRRDFIKKCALFTAAFAAAPAAALEAAVIAA